MREVLKAFHAKTRLPLTKSCVEAMVADRAPRFVSYRQLLFNLVVNITQCMVAQLAPDESAALGWRISFEHVAAFAEGSVAACLGPVLRAYRPAWTAMLRDVNASAAAAGIDPNPPCEEAGQLAALALAVVVEWFVTDLTMRAGDLQQPETTPTTSTAGVADIQIVLTATPYYPSPGMGAILLARCRAWRLEQVRIASEQRAAAAEAQNVKRAAAMKEKGKI